MKFKILNNEPLQFYDSNANLTGTIKISGSGGDLYITPESGSSRNVIIGDSTTVGDVEIGGTSSPVNLRLLGGGTLTSNGNILYIGNSATSDQVIISNATFTSSLQITGSLRVSGSAYAQYFVGDGSGLTNIIAVTASYVNPLNQNVIITGSLANGFNVYATGPYSHAEGFDGEALAAYSHTEGRATQTYGYAAHAEGYGSFASGSFSHSEGDATLAQGYASHSEGDNTVASGSWSHAEGSSTVAQGYASHAEGAETIASGYASHAEGFSQGGESGDLIASGPYSHAEGVSTRAQATGSHTEGYYTQANGSGAHAEGYSTQATGLFSHAEGESTRAYGYASHAEGFGTKASGSYSHTEGYFTITSGSYSHAEGYHTVASGSYQHVQGQFNQSSSVDSAFIIGNGSSDGSRSNLVFAAGSTFQVTGSLDVTGNIKSSGIVYASSTSGFANTTYASNVRNPIWRFGNADSFGLSYFHGTTGVGGYDSIGFHFGTATVAASVLQLNRTAGSNTVTTTGNVGILTTTATYPLTVNGQPGANGYTAFTNYSDIRLKENVIDFMPTGSLDKIKQLRPVSFNYNSLTGYDSASLARTNSGFIAQELQEVCPEMIGTIQINNTEYLDTNTSNLNLYLVRAIQEQQQIIEDLKNRITLLESK
jgi:hypothetical protein